MSMHGIIIIIVSTVVQVMKSRRIFLLGSCVISPLYIIIEYIIKGFFYVLLLICDILFFYDLFCICNRFQHRILILLSLCALILYIFFDGYLTLALASVNVDIIFYSICCNEKGVIYYFILALCKYKCGFAHSLFWINLFECCELYVCMHELVFIIHISLEVVAFVSAHRNNDFIMVI